MSDGGSRLRLGMVGGGRGAFIGEAHRIAARLDDRYELVAGALSSDPQRAIESGRDLRLDPMRCYADWRGMAQVEATRKDDIEVVSVVTPNALASRDLQDLSRGRDRRHLRQAADDDLF